MLKDRFSLGRVQVSYRLYPATDVHGCARGSAVNPAHIKGSLMTTLADYHSVGYVAPVRLFNADVAADLRARFDHLESLVGAEALESAHRPGGGDLLQMEDARHILAEVVSNPVLLDTLEIVLGSDIMLVNTTRFFCRYGPDTTKHTAWHQDVTYLGLEPPEIVTAWYAIDDVDHENGCLRFVSGSHAQGIREHRESTTLGNILNKNQEVELTITDRVRVVSAPLHAGEACVFPGTMLHSAGNNMTPRRRAALACRFINPATRSRLQHITAGLMVRGVDRFGHYEHYDRDCCTDS